MERQSVPMEWKIFAIPFDSASPKLVEDFTFIPSDCNSPPSGNEITRLKLELAKKE
jgi:hypothetical protein